MTLRLVQIKEALSLASSLVENPEEWLDTANDFFFDYSPLEMILLGQADAVFDLLKERGASLEVPNPSST